MKKLINEPARVVEEMLRGMELAHGGMLRLLPDNGVVLRADAPVQGKVALVSGGGSGHEPTHGGYVGPGMLDAACAGSVFTSPTPDQMLEATKAVDGGAGVFYVVKNYTGDVLNFEMAGSWPRPRASRPTTWSPTTTSRSRTRPSRAGGAGSRAPSSCTRSAAPPPTTARTWPA
jgi:dihydroxyacetone kinase